MSIVLLQCGSTARGDSNERSDVDFVCIWDKKSPDFQEIRAAYPGAMFYSISTLSKMKEKGSLFLTHLDIDSVYVQGDVDLQLIFKGYRPAKTSIQKSLDETIQAISEIEWYPNYQIGTLWLCDVLYVALRNCIYCINAIREIYDFGYESALNKLAISSHQKKILLMLREGKYSYRARASLSGSELTPQDFSDICAAIIGRPVNFVHGGITNWKKNWRWDYWGERFVERAILNGEEDDCGFLEKLKQHNYSKSSLKHLIKEIVKKHDG